MSHQTQVSSSRKSIIYKPMQFKRIQVINSQSVQSILQVLSQSFCFLILVGKFPYLCPCQHFASFVCILQYLIQTFHKRYLINVVKLFINSDEVAVEHVLFIQGIICMQYHLLISTINILVSCILSSISSISNR